MPEIGLFGLGGGASLTDVPTSSFVLELNLLKGTAFPIYYRQRWAHPGRKVQHRSNRYCSDDIPGRRQIIRQLKGFK
jgi:hypothetical protein